MVMGEAQKVYLIALMEWRKKKAIEDEQNRKRQALNIRSAFIVSSILQISSQTAYANFRTRKQKLLLFSKQHKKELRKQLFHEIENSMHFCSNSKEPEKFCLFYFDHFYSTVNDLFKKTESLATSAKGLERLSVDA